MKMKKVLSVILVFAMLLSAFAGMSITANASIAEDAESYEMGTWVKWQKGWQENGDRCFEFYISEKSYVTVDCTRSGDFRSLDVYNTNGKTVIRNDEIIFDYNKVKDNYNAHIGKVLNKGTYYLTTAFGGGEAECSVRIQAEQFISMPKGKIRSVKSKKKGQMIVVTKRVNNAIGYRITYSTDERFKTNVKTIKTSKLTKVIKKLKKGKRYYVKVCPYSIYDDGTYVFGKNSIPKSVKIKK